MLKSRRAIFLTGSTGLLGSYLLKIFLKSGHKVFALARGDKDTSAKARVKDILLFWDKNLSPYEFKNLTVVEGDITSPSLGIKSKALINELRAEVEFIFHSAALAKMRVELDLIRKINVQGTRNVLNFALRCKNLEKFNHISTAYVSGTKHDCNFSEDMLDVGQDFYNTYERTKFEAEILVNTYKKEKGLKISIFRPGMIMGDTKRGQTNDFRLFYEPLHFFSQAIYKQFPANKKCGQNLVNVDTVAAAAALLGLSRDSGVYHLVSKEPAVIGDFFGLAAKYFKIRMPEFVPLDKFNFKTFSFAQRTLAEPYIPYFNHSARFLSEKTALALKAHKFSFPKIDKDSFLRIFSYCHKRGFVRKNMPQKNRTTLFILLFLSFFSLGMQPVFSSPTNELSISSATASSTSSSYIAAKTIDKNLATYWQGATLKAPWVLTFDLAKLYSLSKISIFWSKTNGSTNYAIQASRNGTTWVNLQSNLTSVGGSANPSQKDYNLTGFYRYVRLYISKAQSWYPIVYEVKLYGVFPDSSPPKIASLVPLERATFIAGDIINIAVTASSPDQNNLQYRYFLDTCIIKDWGASSSFNFTTTPQNQGRHKLKVEVRDTAGGLDSKATEVYIFRKFPKPAG